MEHPKTADLDRVRSRICFTQLGPRENSGVGKGRFSKRTDFTLAFNKPRLFHRDSKANWVCPGSLVMGKGARVRELWLGGGEGLGKNRQGFKLLLLRQEAC